MNPAPTTLAQRPHIPGLSGLLQIAGFWNPKTSFLATLDVEGIDTMIGM